MAYIDVAQMQSDGDLAARGTACLASEGEPNPSGVWFELSWQIVAAPGWGDKWASAVAGGVERPGRDQSVISDGDLLAQVQAVRG